MLFAIGTSSRKRRSTEDNKFYVEIGEQFSVQGTYTFVKFIPYLRNENYTLTNHSLLCPKFDDTDVRCINEADCTILEHAGFSCKPVDSRRVGNPSPKQDGDDDGPAVYSYVIPIALALLLVVIILFLLYRRRSRPLKVSG